MMYHLDKTLVIFFLVITAYYTGCVDDEDLNSSDPAAAFAEARSYYDDETYDLAVKKLGEFKSRFPYSKFSVLAELYIGNSHFELGQYEEAAVDYKQFVKLHPNHEEVPFVMYRIGESYWIDAPEDIDRDQNLTQTALDEWKVLVKQFPQSQHAKKAQDKMREGRRRIAENLDFVVKFYCKQQLFHACAFRAISLLDHYGEFADIKKSTLDLVILALHEVAKEKKSEPESDKNLFLKRMTESEILAKAVTFEKIAQQLPPDTEVD